MCLKCFRKILDFPGKLRKIIDHYTEKCDFNQYFWKNTKIVRELEAPIGSGFNSKTFFSSSAFFNFCAKSFLEFGRNNFYLKKV